jgi:hypothetical protein
MKKEPHTLSNLDYFPVETRVGPECKRRLPRPDFILSLDEGDGTRRSLCQKCHAEQPPKVAARKETADKAEQFRNLVRAVGKVTAPTISDLNTELIGQFGNLKEFAKFFYEQIKIAATVHNGPGSARVLSACTSVAKIVAMSTQYQASLPEVSLLSDDDLAMEWQRGLVNVLHQLPAAEVEELLGIRGKIANGG